MRISDFLYTTLKSLIRHKLRTALTSLGVVIGVCAILVMISIGLGLKESFENEFTKSPEFLQISVNNWGSDRNLKMDDAAVQKLRKIEGVNTATAEWYVGDVPFNIKTPDDRYVTTHMNIVGTYTDNLEQLGYSFLTGRGFGENEKPYTMVVGDKFVYSFEDTRQSGKKRRRYYYSFGKNNKIQEPFFNNEYMIKKPFVLFAPYPKKDPDDDNEKLRYVEFEPNIIGTVESKNNNYRIQEAALMDINDVKRLLEKYYRQIDSKKKVTVEFDEITVYCKGINDVEGVNKAIKDMGYGTFSLQDIREQAQKQLMVIQLVLGGLAGISLFVAAIGIANTMVMSVIERTREIGIMKVIGAKLSTIRIMFLMEAGMIGLLGGIVGVIFSYGASMAVNMFAQNMGQFGPTASKISIMPPWLVMFALLFSVFIGLLFGFLPANKAVSVSALEAIKHD